MPCCTFRPSWSWLGPCCPENHTLTQQRQDCCFGNQRAIHPLILVAQGVVTLADLVFKGGGFTFQFNLESALRRSRGGSLCPPAGCEDASRGRRGRGGRAAGAARVRRRRGSAADVPPSKVGAVVAGGSGHVLQGRRRERRLRPSGWADRTERWRKGTARI